MKWFLKVWIALLAFSSGEYVAVQVGNQSLFYDIVTECQGFLIFQALQDRFQTMNNEGQHE
jgi:hypothetical protein